MVRGVEGSNDFFIRGGDADQNLVLMNGATVYNTGHLFGFLSVFNPSAIGEVNMMTGGFPAEYGGRLSSIIDIRSKNIRKDAAYFEGGIGLISSRLAVELPIVKDKLAVQVAGRRTYIDQVLKTVNLTLPYYFYDLNASFDWKLSDHTRIHYGFYRGNDILDYREAGDESIEGDLMGTAFTLGNMIHTLSVSNTGKKLQSVTDINFSQFDYDINSFYQDNFLNVVSDIREMGAAQKFNYYFNSGNYLSFGLSATQRIVDPNLINSGGQISEVIPAGEGKEQRVLEGGVFGEWEFSHGQMSGIVGLRTSAAFLSDKTYIQPEPRLALRYGPDDDWAVKASYTRMSQYIHRVSSSSFALPTDVWYAVDEQMKPQFANQWTLGVSKLFEPVGLVVSAEAYYKEMHNLVEFREGTNLILNNDFRDALIQGDGESHGLELLARKDEGRFKGWISYTLSWTNRQFEELNNGNPFPARYDRRHNLSIVGNYDLSDRWALSVVWELISGARFTPIIGYYGIPNTAFTGVDLVPVYPERNSVSLADSHRLDLNLILKGKRKPGKKWRGDWHFSVYNTYNRATPIAIYIEYDEGTDTYNYEQPGLFGLLPSISYNFKIGK